MHVLKVHVARLVDRPHPADPDNAQNAVAILENLAGLE
jgi:hypothetical protein